MKKLFYSILLLSSFPATAQTSFTTFQNIDINNINARILVHGDMWWDPALAESECEFPKGSGKHLMTGGALWVAGYDNAAQLYVSSQTYRQTGNDYWPGPLDTNSSLSFATSADWVRIWKIDRVTINQFKSIILHDTSNTPGDILTWPAKNNPFARGANNAPLIITGKMAPFVDVDKDGNYNPIKGDYPDIKGDQMLWWVFSDNGPTHNHSAGGSLPLKVEVHACAYAYKRNTLIDNVIYYEYYVTNKSQSDYQNFRAGLWADTDLGYHLDDYIGFDSTRRLGYVYNAASVDGTGAATHYGNDIPMAGVVLIKSPNDVQGSLAPAGSFMQSVTSGPPASAAINNSFLRNPAPYAFPGDPTNMSQWSECSMVNAPGDRRFVLAGGDYTFAKGTTALYVFALVASPPQNGNGCPNVTIPLLKEVADTAFGNFGSPVNVKQVNASVAGLTVYPNPATASIYLEKAIKEEQLAIYDATGRRFHVNVKPGSNRTELDISALAPGLYNIVYTDKDVSSTARFIKE